MSQKKFHIFLLFEETSDTPFPLVDIGYNDFRRHEGWKYYRTQPTGSFFFVVNGRGTLTIRHKTHHLPYGNIFFVPPDEFVKYYPDEDDPWEYYWFSFKADVSLFIANTLGLSIDSPSVAFPSYDNMSKALDELFQKEYTSSTEHFYSAWAVFMQILSCSHSPNYYIQTDKPHSANLAQSINDLIMANYANPSFSVRDIANALYISHPYMCKVFKSEKGISPVAHLTNTRLEKAALLLRNKNYSAKELSRAVGFHDELYFMKRFKKHFGMTIKEYKKLPEK